MDDVEMADVEMDDAEGTFDCAACRRQHCMDDFVWLGSCDCQLCRSCLGSHAAAYWRHMAEQLQAEVQPHSDSDPTSYEIQYAGEDRFRETIAKRLRHRVEPKLPDDTCKCPAPSCSANIAIAQLQELAHRDYGDYCEAATRSCLQASGVIECPNCGIPVERLPSRGTDARLQGDGVSEEAADHMTQHRFRCAACQHDFCGECLSTPYHTSLTCKQHKGPKCLYCSTPLEDLGPDDVFILTNRQLKDVIVERGVSHKHCIEKHDLQKLTQRVQQVCWAEECKSKLRKACMKQLACGHWCGGTVDEAVCLPCLQVHAFIRIPATQTHVCVSAIGHMSIPFTGRPVTSMHVCRTSHPSIHSAQTPHHLRPFQGCASILPCDALQRRPVTLCGEDACQICWDPLSTSPAIMLDCGHTCHLACAQDHLKQGYPGLAISFKFLSCPTCGEGDNKRRGNIQCSSSAVSMQHPALSEHLKPHLALREKVVKLARLRLKLEGLQTDPALQPGADFDGRPADFALTKFTFYACCRCQKPFYGGSQECGVLGLPEDATNAGDKGAKELLCGACTSHDHGKDCRSHGSDFIEWKCLYCCSIASFFCFGTTHMCNQCHQRWQQQPGICQPSRRTCTPHSCPLRVAHPDHGKKFCLGCALCRSQDDI